MVALGNGVIGLHLEALFGTAKYGVRREDGSLDEDALHRLAAIPQVKMFEIKLSQGAKPGKGGILPGVKVTPEIAAIRGIPTGEDSNSPNRHPEIGNNDDLLDFIARGPACTVRHSTMCLTFLARAFRKRRRQQHPMSRIGARRREAARNRELIESKKARTAALKGSA